MMPQDFNEESYGGLPPRAGSPSSLTPETDAMMETDAHRIGEYSAPLTAYRRMCDLARTLERERDEWRKKAVDLHARYKGALEDIETAIAERNMARATANTFRQCAEVTFGVMPFPRKFHWENSEVSHNK
jgi:hypothetical protein